MRQLVYLVAVTVDGYIADDQGAFGAFLQEGEHFAWLFAEYPETVPGHLRSQLGVSGPNRHFDAVLMGRATYAVGLDLGVTNPYPHLEQYVVSRTMGSSPDPSVHLVAKPLETVRRLKEQPGADIWLCGGAALASTLVSEIDEVILKVNPVVLGSGVPIFRGLASPERLRLLDTRRFANGFMVNRYRLLR